MRDLNELNLVKGGPQLLDPEYNTFLSDYTLTLPDSYREFMTANNGGYSNIDTYIGDSTPGFETVIDEFFMIGDILTPLGTRPEGVGVRNVRLTLENTSLQTDITSTYYPFGATGGDGYLCIHKTNLKVYSIYQGESEATLIAPSFEAFVDGLVDLSEEDE